MTSSTDRPEDWEVLLAEMHAHDAVGAKLQQSPDLTFVSAWDTDHQFGAEMIEGLLDTIGVEAGQLTSYHHLDEDSLLIERLHALHSHYGEEHHPGFVLSAGSSALLATVIQCLALSGQRELVFVPPVYYNAAYWLRELRFSVRSARPRALTTDPTAIRLPRSRSVLWITDPVWCAGLPVADESYDIIAAWQQRTGSTVVIDGTFAYMSWDGSRRECGARLDPELTVRLVCPTKALALHAFRFAYAIVPEARHAALAEVHGRLHGATSLVDRAFAHRAVSILLSPSANRPVLELAEQRYDELVKCGALVPTVRPSCGYFAFGGVRARAQVVGLGPDCFSIDAPADTIRVNLLSQAAITALTPERAGPSTRRVR